MAISISDPYSETDALGYPLTSLKNFFIKIKLTQWGFGVLGFWGFGFRV